MTQENLEPTQALGPLHILVVDDDPMALDILGSHYEKQGCSVTTAEDGTRALEVIEAHLPDVILCDRVMPGMSGADLLKTVRERSATDPACAAWKEIAFIFVTGLSDRRDKYAMMPLQPDAYLTKPINLAEADLTIRNVLQRRGSVAATQWVRKLLENIRAL